MRTLIEERVRAVVMAKVVVLPRFTSLSLQALVEQLTGDGRARRLQTRCPARLSVCFGWHGRNASQALIDIFDPMIMIQLHSPACSILCSIM
ncbi:hypothetical protein ABZZ74_39510 [Streptomyces sp. NPDC006476]|uniref:hypothetical protein n=1 Tax=Streptomyces sp. NPDC006476 TaxID=3157175 RepID=UPI0033B8C9EB